MDIHLKDRRLFGVAIALAGCLSAVFSWQGRLPWPLGPLLIAGFFVYAVWRNGNWFRSERDSRARLVLGFILSLLTVIVIGCSGYLVWRLDALIAAAAFASPLVLAAFAPQPDAKPASAGRARFPDALIAIALAADALVLTAAWFARTDEALRSPWDAVSGLAVLAYGAATFALLAAGREDKDRVWLPCAVMWHFFAAFAMLETVYALGFGFDPFIHRTAEAQLMRDGLVLPKQPYYTGQYVLVALAAKLSGFSVDIVDRALVPLLAASTLPWLSFKGLGVGWSSRRGVWTLPMLTLLLPFAAFTFTTPFQLAMIFVAWAILLLPFFETGKAERAITLLAAAAAFLVHPLCGGVVVGLLVGHETYRRWRPWVATLATIVANAVLVPSMLAFDAVRRGAAWPSLADVFRNLDYFFGLFQNPYPRPVSQPFIGWDALYLAATVLPAVWAALAIRGLFLQKGRTAAARAVIASAAGLIAAMFFMSTVIRIPGIIEGEQLEFAMRLKSLILLLLTPLAVAAVAELAALDKAGALFPRQALAMAAIAAVAVGSFYLSFPQANERTTYTGWGVSRADFDAVRQIDEMAAGRPYVVISDQMLSVVALRVRGFDRFNYALPTGGRLYRFFLTMAHYRSERSVMEEAMSFSGVDQVFFAVHAYYPGYAWFKAAISQSADEVMDIGGRIVVYHFIKR